MIFTIFPIAPTSLPTPIVSGARAATTSNAFNANCCCESDNELNHSANFCNFGTRLFCIESAIDLISGANDAPSCNAAFLTDSLTKYNVSSSDARADTCSFVSGAIVANSDLN